jgi:hypothetical protein
VSGRRAWGALRAALWIVAALVAVPAFAQETNVSIDVTPRTVREGDAVRVTITVEGEDAGGSQLLESPREIGRLRRVGGVSTGQQFSFVNGRSSVKKTFTFRYVATGAGTARLAPFRVDVGRRELLTEAVEVKVVDRKAPGPDGAADEVVTVDLRVDERQVFLGETIEAEVILRSRVSIRGYDPSEVLEPIPSFVVNDERLNPESTTRSFTDTRGIPWREYTLFRRQLTPTRTGTLEIPAMVFQFQIVEQVRRDGLFDSFFGGDRLRTIARSTPNVTVMVKPLPEEGRPEEFSGLVGRFSLDARLDRTETVVGQAVNLSVSLRGDDPLTTVEPPRVRTPSDLQVFSPEEERVSPEQRRWTYPLVPRAAGTLAFEGIVLQTFDPQTRRYERLTAGPFTLEVAPGRAEEQVRTTGPANDALEAVEARATDLRFIEPAPDALPDRRPALRVPGWTWLAAVLPLALGPLIFFAGAWLERYARSESARRLALSRRVAGRLRRAKRLASRDQADEASLELIRAVHEWSEECLAPRRGHSTGPDCEEPSSIASKMRSWPIGSSPASTRPRASVTPEAPAGKK